MSSLQDQTFWYCCIGALGRVPISVNPVISPKPLPAMKSYCEPATGDGERSLSFVLLKENRPEFNSVGEKICDSETVTNSLTLNRSVTNPGYARLDVCVV